jgi:hypothetical protein
MKRYTIVEICPASHPHAETLVRENKELGFQVYCYRGALILILNDYDSAWRAPDAIFVPLEGAIHSLKEA